MNLNKMELRQKWKEILGDPLERRVFDFCYKECTMQNYPLDWLHPCGFKQYYLVKCREAQCTVELWEDLRDNPNFMYMSIAAKNPGLQKFDTHATFVEKVYSTDHQCGKCGKKKIIISKAQLRSADEGHTNIFTCDYCGHIRKQN
jgi:DNA-directed RNA polymerase subunit M/transcription elongation factor TFIIS